MDNIELLVHMIEQHGRDLTALAVKLDKLEERVDEKFKTAEATFRVLKWASALVVALLTLKFGDLPSLWKALF